MNKWKHLFYPKRCVICRKIVMDETASELCDNCYHTILINDDSIFNKEQLIKVYALFPYQGIHKQAIYRWKYNGIRKYAITFAKLFTECVDLQKEFQIDALIPVPLAFNRYKKRGFNQAEDLAVAISKETDIPVYSVLERTKYTKPQSACTKEQRIQNMRNSIKLKQQVQQNKLNAIAIIDDIYTTGATAGACIEAMHASDNYKNTHFYVFTVCRGGY